MLFSQSQNSSVLCLQYIFLYEDSGRRNISEDPVVPKRVQSLLCCKTYLRLDVACYYGRPILVYRDWVPISYCFIKYHCESCIAHNVR